MKELDRIERQASHDGAGTLVLFHGYGSNKEDLFGLGTELSTTMRIVSVDAPYSLDTMGMPGGRAWFPLMLKNDGTIDYDRQAALNSVQLLESSLSELVASDGDLGPLIVGGFSQGAMMAHALCQRGGVSLDGVLGLSARDMSSELNADPAIGALSGTKVFMSHGVFDQVIPVSSARSLRSFYEKTAVDLSYHEYNMAHEVNAACLSDARAWVTGVLEDLHPGG